ncbi:hypothetical protein [Halorussus halophilus]|uniref:hypothetical protein n=1 Tax=Halorussus halophilus TaxID=2650975 RepID=UPI00130137B4|nr:hypothetical protein [Halorussus halophilus]
MASTWRQLLPQFLIMLLLYFVGVFALEAIGVNGFLPRIGVALIVAFGYPSLLRRMGRAPPAWDRGTREE